TVWRLLGVPDADALKRAWKRVLNRRLALGTAFVQAAPPPVAGPGAEALGRGRHAPAPTHPGERLPAPFRREDELDNPHTMEALGELRRLTESMDRPDPLVR
ncbi:MAG: hypothetical protein GY859_40870, partial [Desulfobacterales bacterium]|nr:hypothetical protein [Desulfobacterales bacterium]